MQATTSTSLVSKIERQLSPMGTTRRKNTSTSTRVLALPSTTVMTTTPTRSIESVILIATRVNKEQVSWLGPKLNTTQAILFCLICSPTNLLKTIRQQLTKRRSCCARGWITDSLTLKSITWNATLKWVFHLKLNTKKVKCVNRKSCTWLVKLKLLWI